MYNKLPWEKEAKNNQNDTKLLKKLLNSKYWINLKGKVPILDYIINNLEF